MLPDGFPATVSMLYGLKSDQLSALLLFYNLAVPDLKGDKKAMLNDFIR
jgi:hypothetical protein